GGAHVGGAQRVNRDEEEVAASGARLEDVRCPPQGSAEGLAGLPTRAWSGASGEEEPDALPGQGCQIYSVLVPPPRLWVCWIELLAKEFLLPHRRLDEETERHPRSSGGRTERTHSGGNPEDRARGQKHPPGGGQRCGR